MPAPSTTTYAVLSLLADGPRSAYELATLMDRSVRFYWPRAVSRVYEEPKKLVASGWATGTEQRGGNGRPRTVYAITDDGRSALRAWLAVPGAGPVLEFEGLVKLLAADHGDIADVRATLDRVETDCRATLAFGRSLGERVVAGDQELMEIAHVRVLTWRLLWTHASAVLDWVRWARGYLADWEDTRRTPERLRAGVAELRTALTARPDGAERTA